MLMFGHESCSGTITNVAVWAQVFSPLFLLIYILYCQNIFVKTDFLTVYF